MSVYNFSPFDPAAPPANPPEEALAGQWVDLPPGLNLPELAARLATTSDADGVKAVPDPWAQPRSFAEALTTSKHPLASVFRAQWRGLLALFALQKTMENIYALELKPLALGEVPTEAGPARDEAQAAASLDRVLTALPPSLGLPGKDPPSWDRPILIRLRRVTGRTQHGDPEFGEVYDIGMMNPASLVSSGRLYSCREGEIKAEEIPWLAGALRDPLEEDLLTPGRRRILSAYLGELYNRLSAICGPPDEDRPGWKTLAEEIGTFRTECEAPEGEGIVQEPFPTDGGPAGTLCRGPLERRGEGPTDRQRLRHSAASGDEGGAAV